ncbi:MULTISPECIES: RNA polymerase sigma factor [Asticcacaulis]|uniref:RNA polymerase sigma factor n=1 Tax=Asticcacaulis TaxID=76890 RepID=UPI001AE39642|nr:MULTISPECIES: sigma-70 family RNA polymerase sigma factor [Asticcacaulis]MBP2160775.1 RNA polymerase sigma factor (sigma-70 family) [Asticcacaulis solisilvae]MDR6801820.1 RNA polymerase sigma factor (sigma-70 family) [Asticcacaulis sp. BE141]
MTTAIARTIDAIWKMEAARIIGGLARRVRDVGLAEDLAQDALIAALEQWPAKGIPPNPGAWLAMTARNKAIDRLRRDANLRRKLDELGHELEDSAMPAEIAEGIQDDVLRLIFTACHPLLPHEAQIALTLRIVCGLTTEEIARAQLVPEPTVQQRIVRAKKKLADAGIGFNDIAPEDFDARLGAVLQVIYLIYNEGYSASSGSSYLRLSLCEEALRLARMLVHMAKEEAEIHALLALMELQSSRARARTDATGTPIPLPEQNRNHWDRLQIARGLKSLETSRNLGGPPGVYYLQAAIAACHARAVTPDATDWPQISALYSLLFELTQSPVVRLNHAVAVGMAYGPSSGLQLLAPLQTEAALRDYHPLWAARGELLYRAERHAEARAAFETAAGMTRNAPEKTALLARAAACGQ